MYGQILLLQIFFMACSTTSQAATPMLYGVTEGSIYKEFVMVYWFDSQAQATISKDGGSAESLGNRSKIYADGQYQIKLTKNQGGTSQTNTVNFQIDSAKPRATLVTHNDPSKTELAIQFTKNSYTGKPIIVIWTEDLNGNFLENLYVSTVAATNYMRFSNNNVKRPQAVPYWAHKTCPPSQSGSHTIYLADPTIPLPAGLDAVSGATQMLGFILKTHVPPPGSGNSIKVLMEINQSFDSGWYFGTSNPIREETDEPSGATFGADPYYAASQEPSLIYAVEVPLNQPGSYTVTEPVGYSHYGGRTGTLYTDFYADDNGTERYKFDIAQQMVGSFSVTVVGGQQKLPGDINGDGEVDLQDAIYGLRICAGIADSANMDADVNEDGKIGLAEVIYILEQVAQ